MKRIIFILFILISAVSTESYANVNKSLNQEDSISQRRQWQLGLRMDINSVIETILLDPDLHPEYKKRFHTYSGYSLSPFGVYLPIRYNDYNIGLELRPGLVMSGEFLTSIEVSFNGYFYPLFEKLYFVSGLTISKHSAFLSELLHFKPLLPVKRSLYWNKYFTSVSLGCGYQIGKNTSIDFTILKSLKEEYGNYTYSGLANTGRKVEISDGVYPLKQHWMMKVGINFYQK